MHKESESFPQSKTRVHSWALAVFVKFFFIESISLEVKNLFPVTYFCAGPI